MLLVVYNFVDAFIFDREEKERPGSQLEEVLKHVPLGVEGWHNVLFLGGIVLVIVAKGRGLFTTSGSWAFGAQELAMIALAAASYFSTRRSVHAANRFGFEPIIEVAILFAGIFVTMSAPLELLNAHGDALGMSSPAQYYWSAGCLSSFLDNAPTHLVRDRVRRGDDGREHVHRERAEFYGESHRRRPRRRDAVVLRIHGVVVRGVVADLPHRHAHLLLELSAGEPLSAARALLHCSERRLSADYSSSVECPAAFAMKASSNS
jgi:hypothetical protein